MTTISALIQEAKGLFWCCDTCREDTLIKEVETDGNTKIELMKEKIKKVRGQEKVSLEELVRQLEIKEVELKGKDSTIEELSNERTVLSSRIEELKESYSATAKSMDSDKEVVSISNTLDKVNKEKETLLQKLQNAMSALNEEKRVSKTVKDEGKQLKEDIKRNDTQLSWSPKSITCQPKIEILRKK